MRCVVRFVAVLVLCAATGPLAWAQSCLGDWPKMFRTLNAQQTARVTKAYGRMSAKAGNGMLAIVGRAPGTTPDLDGEDIDNILEIFEGGTTPPQANPFGADEGLFEAIADLSTVAADGSIQMREGLAETVRQLGNRGVGDEFLALYQGAAHDLYVATQRIGRENVQSFQKVIQVPGGGTRIADVLESCPGGCPSGIFGVFHENKNWTFELSGATDPRLVSYAGQFRRDILIQGSTSWEFYMLNLRGTVAHQADTIRDRLLEEFNDPAVVAQLGAGWQSARDAFVARWDARQLVSFQ